MSKKPTILFVRHGHSVANTMSLSELAATNIPIQDFPLTDRGRSQASMTARYIKTRFGRVDRIISSNYLRAVQTALILFPWRKMVLDPRLGEINYGIWTSLTADQINQQYPSELERFKTERPYFFQPTEGETWNDAEVRIRQVINELATLKHGITAIVGHGHWFNLFQRLVEHLSIHEIEQRFRLHQYVRNASITEYHLIDGRLCRQGHTVTPWEEHI